MAANRASDAQPPDTPHISFSERWERYKAQREAKRPDRSQFDQEAFNQLWNESRLHMPAPVRIPIASITSFGVGMTLGLNLGGTMTGLRFRAEHAHKLPTTTPGWYLYHKSKNYHVMFGGLKEGMKMGFRLSLITGSMFATENLFDVYRGSKDMFNTIAACLAVAGGYSRINRFSALETARTARKGLVFGIAYGAAQDLMFVARGRHVGYVEFARRHLGINRKDDSEENEHAV